MAVKTANRKVTNGFVSFTEVEAGHHHSYNEWHLFDHMPEQFPLDGLVFGQRWVLTPALREHMHATGPLDRIHYVTLYLMADPIDDTLRAFRSLAVALRDQHRFHEHRTAHLFGPMTVAAAHASPTALISAEAVPYRPNRGVHIRLGPAIEAPPLDTPGVAGTWTFQGSPLSPPDLGDQTLHISWLDGPPMTLAPELHTDNGDFSATLATVDPHSPWDWFD